VRSVKMPSVNPVVASAGVIAISVAVAAAIAVYESPELRRMAEDLRRRIAIALHALGDNVNPTQPNPESREPVFNRPEDADGFLESRGGTDHGVDADDETRRRQREELMYWNALLAEKKEKEAKEASNQRLVSSRQGSSFDDFLEQDKDAEKGAYVYNTGADIGNGTGNVLRRRGVDSGPDYSSYSNPFADEHMVESPTDDTPLMAASHLRQDEGLSDIYDATDRGEPTAASATLSPHPAPEVLFDFDAPATEAGPSSTQVLERELDADEYITAGQSDSNDAFASIQAWAQHSNTSFYSPLPMSPPAPVSEPEVISVGAVTPTESASQAGSGEDIGDEAASLKAGEGMRYYDIVSDDEDGMATPASWTEVGSVMSESEAEPMHA
jgi:hypothetical protein